MFTLPARELGLTGLLMYGLIWLGSIALVLRSALTALRWLLRFAERRRADLAQARRSPVAVLMDEAFRRAAEQSAVRPADGPTPAQARADDEAFIPSRRVDPSPLPRGRVLSVVGR